MRQKTRRIGINATHHHKSDNFQMFDGFSHDTLPKSNYRVRLNVNTDITDLISFYFNFLKGYHFVLRLFQHFFDKARLFKMNRVNPAIID